MTMTETRAWIPYRRLIDPDFVGRAIDSYGRDQEFTGDHRIVAACFARLLVGSATKFALRSAPVDGAVDARTMTDHLEFAVEHSVLTGDVRISAVDFRRCELADIDVRRTHAFRDLVIESLDASLRPQVKVSKQLLVSESAVAWYAVLRSEMGPGHECVKMLADHWNEVARTSDFFWEYTVRDAQRRPIPFLIRKACCLEYKLHTSPRYCATCPLVDHRDAIAWQENRLRANRSIPRGDHRRRGHGPAAGDIDTGALRDE